MSTEVTILNVFVNQEGNFGNPVAIIDDNQNDIDDAQRQEMAREIGYSEIVFIDNLKGRRISIYTPQRKIAFAGHAVVGVARLLSRDENQFTIQSGEHCIKIKAWTEGNGYWVEAPVDILPDWNFQKFDSATEIEAISSEVADKMEHTYVWSYLREEGSVIRARTFASDWGIAEDEANGSGSMGLSLKLGKDLLIHHGQGSIIETKLEMGKVSVGGLVKVVA